MSTTTTPGVVQPMLKPYPEGANSARTAGIALSTENTTKQTSLLGTSGGYRKKRRRTYSRLRGGAITVPTMQVLYPETGAGDQSVNGNIGSTTTLSAKTSVDQGYDACLGQGASCTAAVSSSAQKGGKKRGRKSKKGGVKWGCSSGGKRRSKKMRNKNRRKKSCRRR